METTMTSKPRALAAIATASALALFPATSQAGNEPVLGALVGGAFGAAIGHGIGGHDGAIVGGVLGAITGASIATSPAYYAAPYRYAPPVVQYPAAPVYYAPPVVYRSPPVVYRAPPVVVHHVAPRRPVYAPIVVTHPHGRHHGHRHYRDGYGWR